MKRNLRTTMKRLGATVALVGLIVTVLPANAVMVVDRGLPTANLNNAAGSSRANVSWADWETTSAPTEYWLPGDSFSIGGSGTYAVNTIRVWTTGSSGSLTLLGGAANGSIAPISSTYTATEVKYINGADYQGSSSSFSPIYQVDFSVNFNLSAGQEYAFFLAGPWAAYTGSQGGYVNTFLHASNAGLSGSTQQGSDGVFQWLHVNGDSQAIETWYSGDGGGTTGWPRGWDKNSDANVQVFAAPVPEPSTYIAGAMLLLPFGASMVRRFRKS